MRNRLWSWLWTVAYIVSILVCILSYTITYLTESVQVASFSQLLYTLQVSMGGAENVVETILLGFLQSYSLWILLFTVIYIAGRRMMQYGMMVAETKPAYARYASTLQHAALLSGVCFCLLASSLLGGKIRNGYDILGVGEYLESRSRYSTLYENYYVKPDETQIVMPEKKKNLIYIFMESMESTYTDLLVDEDGTAKENVIPNLQKLSEEGESFGKGAQVTSSASWTVAGMVAQTSGTPLCLSNATFTQDFEDHARFMPKVQSLGEILEANGYSNTIMMGSKGEYAGRSNYFSQHGDYDIFDLQTARDKGLIPQDYYEWWGFEDAKLFEYAKDEITRLSQSDQPFKFTMLTADTHFSDGYHCPDCPDTYNEPMKNAIACSDGRVKEFVEWIQQQPFYKDTVIVLAGDHLNMDYVITRLSENPDDRRTYFTVLNGPETDGIQDRKYTTLDIFPTTLAALGAHIEGDRLGLGTNLYSDTPTLSEQLGFESLNEQISSNSRYYDREILDTQDHSSDMQVKDIPEEESE